MSGNGLLVFGRLREKVWRACSPVTIERREYTYQTGCGESRKKGIGGFRRRTSFPAAHETSGPEKLVFMTVQPVATPRPSATVIITRPASESFEILFIRRSSKSSFMGGMSAFPGGTVDPDDYEETVLCSETENLLTSISQTLSPAEQRAFYVAAVRELFEETGVLIARDAQGRSIHGAGSPASDLIREEIDSGKSFSAALKLHQMRLSCAELIPYARWITPTAQPQRFDAYFFLVEGPANVRAEADAHETTSAFWLTPIHALQSNKEGTITLVPPTLKIVHDMARFSTFRELEKSLRPHNLEPVQPVMCQTEDGIMIVLPNDPDYPHAPAGASRQGQRPIGREEEPTRVVFEKGKWTLCLVER